MNDLEFRNKMKAKRKELGITQGELAEWMGWKDGASEISRIETGKLALTEEMKRRIMSAMKLGEAYLIPKHYTVRVSEKDYPAEIDKEGRVSFNPEETIEVKEESYSDVVYACIAMVVIAVALIILL